jgi:hypothetical protein
MPKNLSILPCCETLLVIGQTPAPCSARAQDPPRFQSLDDAIGQVKSRRKEAEEKLSRALEEQRNRDEILEKKFEEARRRAAEDDSAPPRPFEGD